MRFVALLLLSCACTTSREVRHPLSATDLHDLNESMQDREVELDFRGPIEGAATSPTEEDIWRHPYSSKPPVEGVRVSLTPAEVAWLDQGGQPHHAPEALLASVKYLSPGHPRLQGALQGAGLGFLSGLLAGTVVVAVAAQTPPCRECFVSPALPAVVGAFVLFGLGIPIGALTGFAIGHHNEVEFGSRPGSVRAEPNSGERSLPNDTPRDP
jgi:hypothetical protein